MKNKDFIFSIALFLSIFITLVSCGKQKTEWKGTIDEVDGVTVIKNPEEPFYGELVFELEEDLNIGNDRDENYQFYQVYFIILDSHKNIYILDGGNNRVQKYDKNGNYLQTIGRKGQGPGEFTSLYSAFIDGQDNLYVSERRRIQVFNALGEYQRSILLDNNINEFFVDFKGNIISHAALSNEEGSKKVILKMNSKGKVLEKIVEYADVIAVQKKDSGGTTFSFTAYHQYNYWPYLFPISNHKFLYAYPSEYKIFTINSDGDLSLRIEKAESSHSISHEEKDFIIRGIEEQTSRRGRKWPKDVLEAACQFPPHRPFFNRILADEMGRIYVRKVKSVLDKSEEVEFDIFSNGGYYLYRAYLQFTPEIIQKDYLYDIYTSEETGEVLIKRYKIKNWEQIKKGI